MIIPVPNGSIKEIFTIFALITVATTIDGGSDIVVDDVVDDVFVFVSISISLDTLNDDDDVPPKFVAVT